MNFEEFVTWRNKQQNIGQELVTSVLCTIAKQFNAYIIANPVNTVSFAHFLRSDVQSKHFSIRERSAREGLQNGFLQSSSFNTRPLHFQIDNTLLHAVTRNNQQTLTKDIQDEDIPIAVSCYADGSFIVSDVDLLFILFKQPCDEILVNDEYGELSKQEKVCIQEINHRFQNIVGANTRYNLISHGPANRYSQSKISHIHDDLTLYSPTGCTSLGKQMLFDFLAEVQNSGYYLHMNKNWCLQ